MTRALLLSHVLSISLGVISLSGYCKPLRSSDSIEVIFKDTIHVHGKVVDEKGNPLRAINVSTRGYYTGLVQTQTNTLGHFHLKNVQPNDTLFFRGAQSHTKIYHEGSRIINVVLREKSYSSFSELKVTAKRQVPQELKNSTEKFKVFSGFVTYEVPPEIVGGYSKLQKHLTAKLSYPEKAVMANIEGMVKIAFTIDDGGLPTDFKTMQGLGYGCEEAVIDILKEMKWRPGINNGYPYSHDTWVKVLFKLEDM